MAKIEIVQPENNGVPASTETIEVREWGLGGTKEQAFYIGSGLNFQASGNLWLEIIYSVEGAPILYTRNFLQQFFYDEAHSIGTLESRLEAFEQQKTGGFGFGDMLPETSLLLSMDDSVCNLKISIDTGPCLGGLRPMSARLISSSRISNWRKACVSWAS